ncbi:hypothetical protein D3C87_1363440 [compost metagenome]
MSKHHERWLLIEGRRSISSRHQVKRIVGPNKALENRCLCLVLVRGQPNPHRLVVYEVSVDTSANELGVPQQCRALLPRHSIQLAPDDQRAMVFDVASNKRSPVRWNVGQLRFGHLCHRAILNLLDVQIRVVDHSFLPGPHVHSLALRDGRVRQSHPELANTLLLRLLQARTVPELQGLSQ